mgnify:CR=1 FL=1
MVKGFDPVEANQGRTRVLYVVVDIPEDGSSYFEIEMSLRRWSGSKKCKIHRIHYGRR